MNASESNGEQSGIRFPVAEACSEFAEVNAGVQLRRNTGGLKALLIGRYLDFYFRRRPHQGLAGRTPDQAFINALQPIPAAA
jgi:hypothetical protein